MQPGVYYVTFRGLTFAELWRFTGEPLSFVVAVIFKLIGKRASTLWLPPSSAVTQCPESALSLSARQTLLPVVNELAALGYTQSIFRRPIKNYDANFLEGYEFIALHHDGKRSAMVAYVMQKQGEAGPVSKVEGGINLAFIGRLDICFSQFKTPMSTEGLFEKRYLPGRTFKQVHEEAGEVIHQADKPLRTFANIQDLEAYIDKLQEQVWDARVNRGLVVYQSPG
jgi:hypothetical protein